jgi:hypothetical protein
MTSSRRSASSPAYPSTNAIPAATVGSPTCQSTTTAPPTSSTWPASSPPAPSPERELLLVGPIFYRLLFSGAPLDRKLGPRLVDAILAGFAPRTDNGS